MPSIIEHVHDDDDTTPYLVRCFHRLTGREEYGEARRVIGRRAALAAADEIERRRPSCRISILPTGYRPRFDPDAPTS